MNTEILIIEDDPVIRKELQTILEGNKFHTSVIEDFSDVTEQVRKINPHLILLDIKLPQENGFTICSGIRSFSQAPIIFVTSCNTDMDELNSIMLGGDAFITKPLSYRHFTCENCFLVETCLSGFPKQAFDLSRSFFIFRDRNNRSGRKANRTYQK